VRYDGNVMPVIEHVGDEEDQVCFLREMLRARRHVFFITPNRFFPDRNVHADGL
jgi:2-polyprenyl-3-methyl-5-hydroxy-6-metoxy-1,4-benzoquinol methylase